MRKAQDRMRAFRPYGERIRNIAAHLSRANPEYRPPFLQKREAIKNVGLIVITSDKGLCGGMNTNVLRLALSNMKKWTAEGKGVQVTAIGNKGFGFMQRASANLVSHAVGMGDRPQFEKILGPLKVQLDAYARGEIDALYLANTRFVNTMKQDPTLEQVLPLSGEQLGTSDLTWDYIYEPDARDVLDELLLRYIEALIYQAVSENMASEQSARMVAMKAASDNASTVIDELTLVYNKTRQAAITKELSEIVGGAAAV
jgi:F-type H+-transporting ATPase subunit gamma